MGLGNLGSLASDTGASAVGCLVGGHGVQSKAWWSGGGSQPWVPVEGRYWASAGCAGEIGKLRREKGYGFSFEVWLRSR